MTLRADWKSSLDLDEYSPVVVVEDVNAESGEHFLPEGFSFSFRMMKDY